MAVTMAKMLFMATFFPIDEDGGSIGGEAEDGSPADFDLLMEFLKLTVDLADLAGLHLVMQRVSGKGLVKIMVAGLGWAFAELVLTRLLFLWVGARGIEFDWKYMLKSLDANVTLVHFLTLSCLVWLWTRRDVGRSILPVLATLVVACSYKVSCLGNTYANCG